MLKIRHLERIRIIKCLTHRGTNGGRLGGMTSPVSFTILSQLLLDSDKAGPSPDPVLEFNCFYLSIVLARVLP